MFWIHTHSCKLGMHLRQWMRNIVKVSINVNHIDEDQSTYSRTVTWGVNDLDLSLQIDIGAWNLIISIYDWHTLWSLIRRSSQLKALATAVNKFEWKENVIFKWILMTFVVFIHNQVKPSSLQNLAYEYEHIGWYRIDQSVFSPVNQFWYTIIS